MDERAEVIAFLTAHGAGAAGHSYRVLLDHLRGTRALLSQWGAREAVQDAGLFHSVYGTETYRRVTLPLDLRGQVRALIGEEAEGLAYVFGAMTKESFLENEGRREGFEVADRFTGGALSLDAAAFADLCEVFLANNIEQSPLISADRIPLFQGRYRWVCGHASPAAGRAFEAMTGAAPGTAPLIPLPPRS